ncbi:hypothetical protein CC80DRAFT_522810 [Byssothecium circinans]|uniref:Aminoglycoside phosphotransferase domain-containing protein n=1 Tax=Byssothecium circinans TaxID=147558 RepID=A0A6A5UAK8_9PLEO|nr:hypothetical protein CC80DRAFT_522810 [Byssothecium circinans]
MYSKFHDDLLQDYSEAELAHYIIASPRIEPTSSVFLLSATLLAKHYQPPLVEDMVKATEVARQLGTRTPCIKRIIMNEANAYCIMERIRGNTLEEMWTKLGWFTTVKLALQLRLFVNLLRSVTSSTAGSLSTGECRSFWLEDRFGLPARSGPANIACFLRFWVNFTSLRKAIEEATNPVSVVPKERLPPVAQTFVFTHHDLAPRNIQLDPFGQLWLLDWDYAGFYPIYFDMFTRWRWNVFSWIAVGYYEQDARILRQIRTYGWQRQVTTVHICGYRNEDNEGDEDGNPPTNHWAVSLQLDSGGFVMLDMAPGYGSDGRRGKIHLASLASKEDMHTQDTIKTLSFLLKAHTTVENITKLINSKGRERYTFTEEEEGCRFWVYTFISDLEAAGYVDAGSEQSSWTAVSYYWRNPSGYEARTVKEGTFY